MRYFTNKWRSDIKSWMLTSYLEISTLFPKMFDFFFSEFSSFIHNFEVLCRIVDMFLASFLFLKFNILINISMDYKSFRIMHADDLILVLLIASCEVWEFMTLELKYKVNLLRETLYSNALLNWEQTNYIQSFILSGCTYTRKYRVWLKETY